MVKNVTTDTAAKDTKIRWWHWCVLAVAAASLLLAESAYWVRHTLLDQQAFTTIATQTLQEEQNRTAIAAKITDAALQNRPVLQATVSDRVTPLVSGILASDLGTKVLDGTVSRTHNYLLTPDRQDIAIQLGSIKQVVTRLADLADTVGRESELKPSAIPDEIVLLDKDALPDMSGLYKVLVWVAPLCWLAAIGLAIWFVTLGGRGYARRVYAVCVACVLVAAIGLATGPFVPPVVATLVADINIQTVADSMVSAFLAPFLVQMWWLCGVATGVTVLFWQRQRLLRGAQLTLSKLTPRA